MLLFFHTFLTAFWLLSLHTLLPRSLLLLDILPWKVTNSNDATLTTAYNSTDSSAQSVYKGSKPVTHCKPVSDCCRCNDKGSCWPCRCVKVGNICTNCPQLQHDHCMNNKHIRNTSLTSNMTTINNEFTNVLAKLMENSTPPHANQFTQSGASHASTLSDKPVSDCKPLSHCCRCNDKSSCRCC